MNRQLRTAVVGVGYLGRFHAQKHKALSEKFPELFRLVAVVDNNLETAKRVSQELGVDVYQSGEELLGKVDAVSIATNTPYHFQLAEFFLKNKIHVNVEKPITVNVEQAKHLVGLAEQYRLTLSVGHSERYNPAFVELKKRMQHSVRHIEFRRLAPYRGRGGDVSVIHDLMIHDIDLLNAIDSSKGRIVSASAGKAITENLDWAQVQLQKTSGLTVSIQSSRLNQEMERKIIAYGSDCVWNADLQTGTLKQSKMIGSEWQHEVIETAKVDNLYIETETFLRAVLGLGPNVIPGRDGLSALLVVDEILAELASDRCVF